MIVSYFRSRNVKTTKMLSLNIFLGSHYFIIKRWASVHQQVIAFQWTRVNQASQTDDDAYIATLTQIVIRNLSDWVEKNATINFPVRHPML